MKTEKMEINSECTIKLLISYQKAKNSELLTKEIVADKDNYLGEVIEDFLINNNIKIKNNYYLYLKRSNYCQKELDRDKYIDALGLKNNDTILISLLPNLSEISEKIKIYPRKKHSIKKKKKIIKIYI